MRIMAGSTRTIPAGFADIFDARLSPVPRIVARHPEVRALASLEGRRPERLSCILRGTPSASKTRVNALVGVHLRMRGHGCLAHRDLVVHLSRTGAMLHSGANA
jgi:hypothetical protein